MRKPLVTTTEQQTSILKKSYLQERPEKVREDCYYCMTYDKY